MKNTLIITLLICTAFFSSCKETYDPEISDQPSVLVVDALITDEVKEHVINLSRAIPFDTTVKVQEVGATVSVKDSHGNIYNFRERKPGFYYSYANEFIPTIGEKYSLSIKTKDGKEYISPEQELLPEGTMAEVTNHAQEIPYYLVEKGKVKIYDIKGAEFLTSQVIDPDQIQYYRFSNTLLAEYTSRINDSVTYCWKKYNSSVYFLLNDIQTVNQGAFQQKLGFLPLENSFYSIVDVTTTNPGRPTVVQTTYNDLYHFVVTFKQYHLNKEVYQTYKQINQQLKASQRIFDPMAVQIRSNVTSVSNPNELVLGLFEVSSVSINSYIIEPLVVNGSYNLNKISPVDFDSISDDGFSGDIPPKTWIY